MASATECPEKTLTINDASNADFSISPPEALPWPAPPPPYSASSAPMGFVSTGLSGQSAPPSYAYATESTTFVQQPAQHTIVREVLLVESPRSHHRRRSPLGLLAKIVHQGQDSRHPSGQAQSSECNCQHQEGCVNHAVGGHLGHHKQHRGHKGHRGHHHH